MRRTDILEMSSLKSHKTKMQLLGELWTTFNNKVKKKPSFVRVLVWCKDKGMETRQIREGRSRELAVKSSRGIILEADGLNVTKFTRAKFQTKNFTPQKFVTPEHCSSQNWPGTFFLPYLTQMY